MQLYKIQICIGTSSIEVYRPAGNFVPGATKNMAAWPNCRQLQPPRSMNGDTFQCEEYKIRSFLSTIKGRATLGFPADAETSTTPTPTMLQMARTTIWRALHR